MVTVYKASNSLEAQMIRDLLIRAGLQAELEGFYLQGGVGELQANDIVRVIVPDEETANARQIISEWEATEPETPTPEPSPRSGVGIGAFIVGVAFGMAGMYWFYTTPVTSDGIDYDGDGSLDEIWHYQGGRIAKSETDRDRDGNVDVVTHFDHRGLIDYSLADEDLNGTFETEYRYNNGNLKERISDLNGDSRPDYRERFVFGVLHQAAIDWNEDGTPRTLRHYSPFQLTSAEYDVDGDGNYDRKVRYNRYGQPITDNQ